MGAAQSGELVSNQFFDRKSQKNFLASMESVDPKTALSVTKKLESGTGSAVRFVLMTTGESESIYCWQAKNLFVCSWVIRALSIKPFTFVKHKFQNVEFVSIHLDACAFSYMKHFMDLAMFFLSKEEFLKRIVELGNDSDELVRSFVTSQAVEPVTIKPTFSLATPDIYYIDKGNDYSNGFDDSELDLDSGDGKDYSQQSKPIPHPFIPELEDLQFEDSSASSFLSPIPEYSDSTANHTIRTTQQSSYAGPVSDVSSDSEDRQAFVNGGRYSRTREINGTGSRRSGRNGPAGHLQYNNSSGQNMYLNGEVESRTLTSESNSSDVGHRKKQTITDKLKARSRLLIKAHNHEDEPLDMTNSSNGPELDERFNGIDSIVLGDPSSSTTSGGEYSGGSTSLRSGSKFSRSQASKDTSASKRRPAVLVPQAQQPNDDLILSSGSERNGNVRQRYPKRKRTGTDDQLDMSGTSSESYRGNRYGGTTDQVPMSSDDGIANDLSNTNVSSRDFRSRTSKFAVTRTGDTNPVSVTSGPRHTGQLTSGSTTVPTAEFNQYMGTGTASLGGRRKLRNNDRKSGGMDGSTSESVTDSNMHTGTSDFNTEKFKPFSNQQTNTRHSFSDEDETFGNSGKNSVRGSSIRTGSNIDYENN